MTLPGRENSAFRVMFEDDKSLKSFSISLSTRSSVWGDVEDCCMIEWRENGNEVKEKVNFYHVIERADFACMAFSNEHGYKYVVGVANALELPHIPKCIKEKILFNLDLLSQK